MALGTTVGAGVVPIRPDFSDFSRRLSSGIDPIFRRTTANLKVDPETKGFAGRLRSAVDPVFRSTTGDVKVGADTAGFGRQLQVGTYPAVSRLGDHVRHTLGTAFKMGAAAAGAALGATGLFGIRAAGNFEQTRIAFEGILGSAERAESFLTRLRDFAAKTPFEFPELADASKQLLAVGFNAADVLPIMTKLGNTSAALGVGGESINGVVRALGQMKGKGKASAEELNQISEQIPGFSAIKAIAEDMGVSTEEAFKRMEKGAVPADQAISAILAGMERFPGAAGAMDRQSKTLNGVISTIKDTFRDALINGIEPFLPAISSGLAKAGPALGKFVAGAIGGIGTVIRNLTQFGGAFKSAFSGEGVTSDGAVGQFERLGFAVRTVVDFVTANWKPIVAALVVGFTAWAGSATAAAVATLAAISPIALAVAAIAGLAAGLVVAYQRSETFRTVVQSALAAVQGAVSTFTAVVRDLWARFGDQLLEKLRNSWNAIRQVVDGALSIIKGVFDVFAGIFTGDWSRVWDGIKEIATGALDVIVGVVRHAVNLVSTIIGAGMAVISAAWSLAWNAVSTFLSDAWEGIKTAVSTALTVVVGFMAALPGRILGALGDIGRLLWDKGRDLVGGLLGGIGEVAEDVFRFIRELPGQIVGALGDLGRILWDKGKELIGGFVGGIKEAVASIPGAIGGAIRSVGDALNPFGDGWGVAPKPGGGSIGEGTAGTTAYLRAAGVPFSVSSAFRSNSITSSGNLSLHSIRAPGGAKATDFVGPSLMAIAQAFLPVAGNLRELIYTPLGFSIKNGQRVAPYAQAQHHDHVHVATYDQGGIVPPGRTLVNNATGHDEVILPIRSLHAVIDRLVKTVDLLVGPLQVFGQLMKEVVKPVGSGIGKADGSWVPLSFIGDKFHKGGISTKDALLPLIRRDEMMLDPKLSKFVQDAADQASGGGLTVNLTVNASGLTFGTADQFAKALEPALREQIITATQDLPGGTYASR